MSISAYPLSQTQIDNLPTPAEVAFFAEHGWYISPPVIPWDSIDEAILGSEAYYRGERDARIPFEGGFCDWQPTDGDAGIRNNEFVSLQNWKLRQLALQPIIGAIAARLVNTQEIRLLDDQLIYKPPITPQDNTTVGWHTDRAYWSTCSSDNLLTAWIPFHDCDESRGPLVVLDGSHQWEGLQDLRFFNHQNLTSLEDQFRQAGKDVVRIPMVLKKGQISFHHGWTIHGSLPNQSQTFRLALAVHLQDDANQYRPYWDSNGEPIHMFDEKLCQKLPNGNPDFRDPAIFPVIWSEKRST